MSLHDEYEALRQQHLRLRAVAQAVLDAADYPDGVDEARIYRSQLADLRRELRGEPQPNGLKFMSMSVS